MMPNDAKCNVILLVIGILGRGWNTSFFLFLAFSSRQKTPWSIQKARKKLWRVGEITATPKGAILGVKIEQMPNKSGLALAYSGNTHGIH